MTLTPPAPLEGSRGGDRSWQALIDEGLDLLPRIKDALVPERQDIAPHDCGSAASAPILNSNVDAAPLAVAKKRNQDSLKTTSDAGSITQYVPASPLQHKLPFLLPLGRSSPKRTPPSPQSRPVCSSGRASRAQGCCRTNSRQPPQARTSGSMMGPSLTRSKLHAWATSFLCWSFSS